MPAIYTRTGDKGDTGLFGGSRVAKQSLRVEAYGTVDEANSSLGKAKAALSTSGYAEAPAWHARIHRIQQRMFVLAAELASDPQGAAQLGNKISADDIAELEHLIDDCMAITGPQRAFVVPGRDLISGHFRLARTVIRRAERRTLTLAHEEPLRRELITYLNRLSDAVYALARLTETWHDLAQVERIVRDAVAKFVPRTTPSTPLPPDEAGGRWRTMRECAERRCTEATLRLAQRLATAAEHRADELGVPMVIAVVDRAGNLVLLHRMPESLVASLEIAPNKAWTANAFKNTTAAVGKLAAAGGPLPGVEGGNSGRVVLFGGGAPLLVDGAVIGALGISGGTVEEDVVVMNHAIDTVLGAQK